MKGDVICRSCGESYHETTGRYKATRPTNATMLRMKEPWKGYGWDEFPQDESFGYDSLGCPGCGVSYCNTAGYAKVVWRIQPGTARPMNVDKGKEHHGANWVSGGVLSGFGCSAKHQVNEPVKVVTNDDLDRLMQDYDAEPPVVTEQESVQTAEPVKPVNPKRPFVCPYCGKDYTKKRYLNQHISKKHKDAA